MTEEKRWIPIVLMVAIAMIWYSTADSRQEIPLQDRTMTRASLPFKSAVFRPNDTFVFEKIVEEVPDLGINRVVIRRTHDNHCYPALARDEFKVGEEVEVERIEWFEDQENKARFLLAKKRKNE